MILYTRSRIITDTVLTLIIREYCRSTKKYKDKAGERILSDKQRLHFESLVERTIKQV